MKIVWFYFLNNFFISIHLLLIHTYLEIIITVIIITRNNIRNENNIACKHAKDRRNRHSSVCVFYYKNISNFLLKWLKRIFHLSFFFFFFIKILSFFAIIIVAFIHVPYNVWVLKLFNNNHTLSVIMYACMTTVCCGRNVNWINANLIE